MTQSADYMILSAPHTLTCDSLFLRVRRDWQRESLSVSALGAALVVVVSWPFWTVALRRWRQKATLSQQDGRTTEDGRPTRAKQPSGKRAGAN